MRRHAVLITNSFFPYASTALGELKTVQQDLDGVKSILRDLRGRFEITVLPDMEATEIIRTLDNVLQNVGERDLLLIYYAGHGRILPTNHASERLLLATYRSGPDPNVDEDLPFKRIETQLASRRIRRAVIVLDCCYSGAVDSNIEPRGGTSAVTDPEILPFDMKQYQRCSVSQLTDLTESPNRDADPTEADADPNMDAPPEDGIFIMTACTGTQVALGNRAMGSGDFTRHFIESLKAVRDQSLAPITVKSVFARIRESMDQSQQTPMLICRNGNGDLTIAREKVHGEGNKRTLLNWVPLPKEVIDSSLGMSPVYILDSGFRFVHWNAIFEDVIARQLGLVLGAHALELIENLDNKSAVLNRNPRFFPNPDPVQLAQADESGVIWSGFPLTDVERLEFRSDRFKLIVFDKQAYQLPTANFGGRQYWHVQLNVQYVQRRKLFWENARKLLEAQDMWNEYANSYDTVISPYDGYKKLVDEMTKSLAGKTQCLDIGSGTGNMVMAMLKDPKRRVTAVEINDMMLKKLITKLSRANWSKRVTLLRGDAKTILERMARERRENAEEFDCCTMMNVLYTLDDPIECLKAVYRVLKPNGLLVVSTPYANTSSGLSRLFEKLQSFHQREGKWPEIEKQLASARRINEKLCDKELFTAEQICQMLREAKFEVESSELHQHFEGCILVAAARKPDTRIIDKTPNVPPDTPVGTSVAKRAVNIFVSYSRENLEITNEFLDSLKRQLKPAKRFHFKFFKDDENILVGQNWRDEIELALRDCHVGLLLLSPDFLGSEFIINTELVRFFQSNKVIVPVLLDYVDLKEHDLKGLEDKQIFRLDLGSDGRAYRHCDEDQRQEFVRKLFERIVARLEAVHQSQPKA